MLREIIEYVVFFIWIFGFVMSYAFGDIPAILYIVISLIIMCRIHIRGLKKLFLLIIKSINYADEKQNYMREKSCRKSTETRN